MEGSTCTIQDMFSVEESGREKLTEEEERNKVEAFNRELVGLLRRKKLVLL